MDGIVHIYSHYAHHTDAIILGDEQGLIALRDAINEAIYPGKRKSEVEVFCNDGEGYTIKIGCIDKERIDLMPVPYTASYAKDKSQGWLSNPINFLR